MIIPYVMMAPIIRKNIMSDILSYGFFGVSIRIIPLPISFIAKKQLKAQ